MIERGSLFIFVLLGVLVAGTGSAVCADDDGLIGGDIIGGDTTDGDVIGGDIIGGGSIGMANPAAEHCVNEGYESRNGRCYFPDGSSCDEWEFYRGECSYDPGPIIGPGGENPASVYCTQQGYQLEIRGGTGYCIFPDGSCCEEWKFYSGQCSYNPKPTPPTPSKYQTYCTDQGFRWNDGMCCFPDGSCCEGIAFYEGACKYNPKAPEPKTTSTRALYTCQPLLVSNLTASEPALVQYQNANYTWIDFEKTFSATSPGLWMATDQGWSQNATAPLDAWTALVMYAPVIGNVSLEEIRADGTVHKHDLGQAYRGYNTFPCLATSPGSYILIVTANETASNAVFFDVNADWKPCGPTVTPSSSKKAIVIGA